ncbi:multisubstrate pseudouridine synthase 7 [Magnolia sinica]|uniref:multisubstrate pseudouridine synthase 7 n=1 Tax=Magnolia sinica TaxID=86752 RepID=UPI00265AC444|nr:multisubstrate pseudouridine synthase 7 [Magnolia sinica]
MLGIGVLSFPLSLLKPFTKTTISSNKLKPHHRFCSCYIETLAMKTLDEADVGILCYISKLPGFRGVLKQRYSDFIVNEVDCNGNVVHLTSFDLPPEKIDEKESKILDSTPNDSHNAEIESFRSLAGDADAESLKGFLERIQCGVENDISPIVLSADANKSHRTEVHNFFKANFKFLVTDTVEGPDASSKCIRVRFSSGDQRDRGRNSKKRKERGGCEDSKDNKPFDSRGSNDWPNDTGKFLRFHLYKENKDTQEALGLIGKMLGIQQRSFGFAGTKDKRSISTQRVTVFKQQAKRLAALNDRLIGIKVGDFCYVQEELVLGKLLGNRFTITLRGVVADSEDVIKATADDLGRNGFINYFGLQRFGSGSVPTHFVGAALLRGEWKIAVGLILDPREGERDIVREVREYYKESGDIEGTLRRLPRYLVAERAILQCLKKCPGNYLQALKAIPRTMRMMYVHSYQSYLWNHAASMRVQKYGNGQVMLGDLVYCKGSSPEKIQEVVNIKPEDCSCNDALDYSNLDEIPEAALLEEKVHSVKAVNAEDLLTGDYTVNDIILPLPGSRIIYPMNDIANVYHDLAKKDRISLTESIHSVKEFSITSMTGGYRRVFQQPIDFEWEVLRYTDCNVSLAETDLDIIAKSRPANIIEEPFADGNEPKTLSNNCVNELENLGNRRMSLAGDHEAKNEIEKLPQVESICSSDAQPPQMALKLGFTLPASSYATMAIRELLKSSTSAAYQKTLNP